MGVVVWTLDIVMQNCWPFYRENKKSDDPTLDLVAFWREVVHIYLKKYMQP